jgi:hypothetical protein
VRVRVQVAFAANAGISPLVKLLAEGNERAQVHAAHALASIGLHNSDNQAHIATQLVDILGKGASDAKSRAAAALWRLVHENESSQQTIATAGSASDLIALLKEGSEDAQAYALWSLSLSITAGNQQTVLDEDGVEPLVAALSAVHSKTPATPAGTTREQAAAALSLLAHDNKKAQAAIAVAGGVAPLIEVLLPQREDSMASRENAAAALAEMVRRLSAAHH